MNRLAFVRPQAPAKHIDVMVRLTSELWDMKCHNFIVLSH